MHLSNNDFLQNCAKHPYIQVWEISGQFIIGAENNRATFSDDETCRPAKWFSGRPGSPPTPLSTKKTTVGAQGVVRREERTFVDFRRRVGRARTICPGEQTRPLSRPLFGNFYPRGLCGDDEGCGSSCRRCSTGFAEVVRCHNIA